MKKSNLGSALCPILMIFFPGLAKAGALPACLDGYAFHGDHRVTARVHDAETGNGNVGSNFETSFQNPDFNANKLFPARIWNGDIKSHGRINIARNFTVNGNLVTGDKVYAFDGTTYPGAKVLYDHIQANTAEKIVVNGNVSFPADGWLLGDVTVNGTVNIGAFGWLTGTNNNYISGNTYIGGKSTLQAGPYIKGSLYVVGDLATGPVGGPSCTMYYNTLFTNGKTPWATWPDCPKSYPIPSPSPFPSFAAVEYCKYVGTTVSIGSTDVTVPANATLPLLPGSWRDVRAVQNGCLSLNSGSYSMQKLSLSDGSCLELNTAGGNIEINVRDSLMLAGQNPIRFVGADDPSKFKLYFAGKYIDFRSSSPKNNLQNKFIGTLYAPFARATFSDYDFNGTVYANDLNLLGSLSNVVTPYIPGPMAQVETLKSLADKRGIKVGTAVNWTFWDTKVPQYRELLEKEYSIIVSENDMKFEGLEPTSGVFLWKWADDLVNYSNQKNIELRGHALVWHEASGWAEKSTGATRDEMLFYMKRHIDSVMAHFKGNVKEWDVLNEAIDQWGTGYRNSFWLQRIGVDYIDSAFTWAHRADPNVVLYYNDYGGEDMGMKSDKIYDMVKGLLNRGVPIHGVGFQCHFESWPNFSVTDIDRNIKRLGALGLQVSLTEVDFRISPLPASAAAVAAQKKNYYDLMKVCLDNSNCKSFITWGFNDGESWVPTFFPGWGDALPFDANYGRKPAYDGMMEALKNSPVKTPTRASFRTKKVNSNSTGWNGRPAYVIPGSGNFNQPGKIKAYNTLGKFVGHVGKTPPVEAAPKK